MAQPRIDVSIEHKAAPSAGDESRRHPNTCPACGSHYRDDELDDHLGVCPHCGHHFPVPARERIAPDAPGRVNYESITTWRSTHEGAHSGSLDTGGDTGGAGAGLRRIQPGDGAYLSELRGATRSLSELLESLEDCGTTPNEAKAAMHRLLGAKLTEPVSADS